jgi:TfoX/Sxy family transcriptional regulator of competence genes
MAEPYLQELQSLLTKSAPRQGRIVTVTCKHFFAGAAAYVDGHIFMSFTPAGLALKLPEDARAELRKLGAKPLRYFPKAPIKKDYLVVSARMATDPKALSPWIAQSIAFARAGGTTR